MSSKDQLIKCTLEPVEQMPPDLVPNATVVETIFYIFLFFLPLPAPPSHIYIDLITENNSMDIRLLHLQTTNNTRYYMEVQKPK